MVKRLHIGTFKSQPPRGVKPAKKRGHLSTGPRERSDMDGMPTEKMLDPASTRMGLRNRVGHTGGKGLPRTSPDKRLGYTR